MKYFKKLIGDRIYLSPMNSEDIELFVKWLNDFEITDYLGRSGNIITINDEEITWKTKEVQMMQYNFPL